MNLKGKILKLSKQTFLIVIYFMQPIQFPKGNIYQIICQAGNLALKIQTNNRYEYNRARIIGAPPNVHDMGQLFMI